MSVEFVIGDSTVTVEYEGWDIDQWDRRRRYRYVITTPDWQYVDNDIRSGHMSPVDEPDMARTLFSFMSACAESRSYPNGECADLFPDHVGQWCELYSDELSWLSIDPREFDQ